MTRLEHQRETTRTDFEEIDESDIKQIASWLFVALHVALERPSNREWLAEYHRKQEKKLFRATSSQP